MIKTELKELEKKRQPTECYNRVCGYIRPISQWNEGKRQEFDDRVDFQVVQG